MASFGRKIAYRLELSTSRIYNPAPVPAETFRKDLNVTYLQALASRTQIFPGNKGTNYDIFHFFTLYINRTSKCLFCVDELFYLKQRRASQKSKIERNDESASKCRISFTPALCKWYNWSSSKASKSWTSPTVLARCLQAPRLSV